MTRRQEEGVVDPATLPRRWECFRCFEIFDRPGRDDFYGDDCCPDCGSFETEREADDADASTEAEDERE